MMIFWPLMMTFRPPLYHLHLSVTPLCIYHSVLHDDLLTSHDYPLTSHDYLLTSRDDLLNLMMTFWSPLFHLHMSVTPSRIYHSVLRDNLLTSHDDLLTSHDDHLTSIASVCHTFTYRSQCIAWFCNVCFRISKKITSQQYPVNISFNISKNYEGEFIENVEEISPRYTSRGDVETNMHVEDTNMHAEETNMPNACSTKETLLQNFLVILKHLSPDVKNEDHDYNEEIFTRHFFCSVNNEH